MRDRKRKAPPGGTPANPYREVAEIYDRLVGDTAFELWRENFEQLQARYGISFETACDVACGTGHAVEYLAGSCRKVYGTDISREMLDRARARTKSMPVVLLEQAFDELELPEKVELVTCNFDSLNYLLTEEDLGTAFARFAACLVTGGYCVFDMNTTRELEQEWGNELLVHWLEGAVSIWETEWDEELRINTLHMTNFIRRANGLYERSEEVHRERSYDLDLVVGLVEDAGFGMVEAFDAKDLGGVSAETRRVQFVARF